MAARYCNARLHDHLAVDEDASRPLADDNDRGMRRIVVGNVGLLFNRREKKVADYRHHFRPTKIRLVPEATYLHRWTRHWTRLDIS